MADFMSLYLDEPANIDKAARVSNREQVRKRYKQTLSNPQGAPVWFSSHIIDGRIQHWTIFIRDTKFEIESETQQGNAEAAHFAVKTAPWTLAEEMKRIHETVIAGQTYADRYYICQVGWAPLQKKQLADKWQATKLKFRMSTTIGLSECQVLLKHFTDSIINRPNAEALDYAWFAKCMRTEYQNLADLDAPDEIKKTQPYLMAGTLSGKGILAALGYDAQAHNLSMADEIAYKPEEPMKAQEEEEKKKKMSKGEKVEMASSGAEAAISGAALCCLCFKDC